MKLSDQDAATLAGLLLDYFEDALEADPTMEHPGTLTVRELLEDLASSTVGAGEPGIVVSRKLNLLLDLFEAAGGHPA